MENKNLHALIESGSSFFDVLMPAAAVAYIGICASQLRRVFVCVHNRNISKVKLHASTCGNGSGRQKATIRCLPPFANLQLLVDNSEYSSSGCNCVTTLTVIKEASATQRSAVSTELRWLERMRQRSTFV